MRRNWYFILAIAASVTLASCGGAEEVEENGEELDSLAQVDEMMDKIEEAMDEQGETAEDEGENEMQSDVEAAAQEASGEVDDSGLTFCDCVKKMDKLEKDLDAEEDGDKIMAIMDEMENLLGGDCSVLKAKDQKSVEDQEAHKARVKRCLGG